MASAVCARHCNTGQKWKKISLLNEVILQQALADNHIQFDYNSAIRILIVQKMFLTSAFCNHHKPKKVIIECPYTIMGAMCGHCIRRAFLVIELQHGVLNDKHYAYNSLYSSPISIRMRFACLVRKSISI